MLIYKAERALIKQLTDGDKLYSQRAHSLHWYIILLRFRFMIFLIRPTHVCSDPFSENSSVGQLSEIPSLADLISLIFKGIQFYFQKKSGE